MYVASRNRLAVVSHYTGTSLFGLMNGGTAGLIWGYLVVWAGYMLVFATMAEMASMAPTSGGQYHLGL